MRSASREPSGHRVVAFKRLGEALADRLRKGDHVLVDGQLVSRKYENENGKSKKSKGAKFVTFWSVRANFVKRLTRTAAESPAAATRSEAVSDEDIPF
jgi:single-stranded DNA-binding protein